MRLLFSCSSIFLPSLLFTLSARVVVEAADSVGEAV